MSSDVMPFVRPASPLAGFGPWLLADEDDWRPLPAHLPDWDYQTDLVLQRQMQVDVDGLLRESQLPSTTPVAVVVEWRASAAQLNGLALRRVIDSSVGPLEVTLRGSDLAGRLSLITRLVVAEDTSTPQPFVASRAGDVLAEDQAETQLQGEAARFPIYVVDFAAHDLDADARWHLDVTSDPAHAAAGGVRLFLNADDKEIVNAAVRAANPTPVQRRLLEWLHTDVTRQLIDRALTQDWIDALPNCMDDPDSLGASLSALVSNLFDGEPLTVVAKLRETDPGRFATRLQGALIRLGRGVVQ
ncbi:hypothetical protein [Actinophytocola sp.]|uniref:hypothetical protein n=1 Tax=Actinophytocola sp. TaxID=1872138 RepID=UPI00389B1F41